MITWKDYLQLKEANEIKMKSLDEENRRLWRECSKARGQYIRDNAPFEEECFVMVTFKLSNGKTRGVKAWLWSWGADDDGTIIPYLRKVVPYHKDSDDWSGIRHYYVSREHLTYRRENYVGIKKIEPLPMHVCDTCSCLNMRKDGCFGCNCHIDKNDIEQGSPACNCYSYWTWSRSEGGITHREQLQRDNGARCKGEQQASAIFSKVLDEAAERGYL